MQAYKLKGKIDATGHLTLTQSIDLPAGEVEVIILQEVNTVTEPVNLTPEVPRAQREISKDSRHSNIFSDWLAKAPPVSPDFDADQARWEALREKHQL
ncbi:MAG: hypothetical protein KME19_22415 [Microcoleus vaginatus WJT46-NPBG5]|nr:hypothetical protein [Microcoleus vaginatus WJT46-NPBG5]